MTLRVPKLAALLTLAFVVAAGIVFVWLMGRFGGPSVRLGDAPYHVRLTVPDTQGLATKSDVLSRGVKVGEVSRIDVHDGRADVELTIRQRYRPLHLGDRVRVGQKTLLGEAYVDVERAQRRGPPIADGGRLPARAVGDAVELDEALDAVGSRARPAIRSMLRTFARGARSPETADRLNATLARLDTLTGELRNLGATLRGQERTIAALVTDSRTALGVLGARRGQISEIVRAGQRTLAALAARRAGLRAGVAELPRTLRVARDTLTDLRPLLAEARPLLTDLRRAAPAMTPALRDLRPAAGALGPSLRQTRPFLRATTPVIRDELRPFARDARPTVRLLRPAARDLAAVTPALTDTLKIANYALNELTYDKPGDGHEPYLFWFAWANRVGASLFATQDAHGPVRRGLLVLSCASLETLDQLALVNAQLGLLIRLLDPPRTSEVCPKTSQAGTGTAAARSRGGVSPASPDAPKPITDARTAATQHPVGEAR